MKTLIYKLAIFLLYIGVAGLTFFMYNLREEVHVSPFDVISQSGMEAPADENISTKRIRKLLLNDIKIRIIVKEKTDTLAPIVLNQLVMASKGCSSDFVELDSLLTGPDPDRLLRFMHRLLGFAAPNGTKERLNTEVVRFTFSPTPVQELSYSQNQTRCITVDFIKPKGESIEEIVSIQGVSRFLIHSIACE